jgi:cyanophycin synthetase
MEVSRIRALRGPNLWSRRTALEAIVACSPDESCIDNLAGFEPRLRALFPDIGVLRETGHTGPVSLAHVLQAVAFELQAAAGSPVTFGRTSATLEQGTYQVVVEYCEEAVGRLALELAQALIHAALQSTSFDLQAAIAQLRDLDEDERLGPSTGAIVDAAVARGIPYRRLTRGSMVQFGWGSRQRRIQAA